MPPRYAYWTILVDEQPTAFRAAVQEELQPTFKRLKEKHPSARMVWFQNGKIWNSRLDAQEAMRARGEMGRRGDARQHGRGGFDGGGGGFRDRDRNRGDAPDRFRGGAGDRDRSGPPRRDSGSDRRDASGKLDWRPKTAGPQDRTTPRPRDPRPPRPQGLKPSKPHALKPSKPHGLRPSKPHALRPSKPHGLKPSTPSGKLEWRPKGESPAPPREKRKWIPKDEYTRTRGSEPRRDKNWRPGGEHKDPRQKYKDAKKAKWTRFKQTIRKRWENKHAKKKG